LLLKGLPGTETAKSVQINDIRGSSGSSLNLHGAGQIRMLGRMDVHGRGHAQNQIEERQWKAEFLTPVS
jgi:hypothetical protein